MWYRFGLAFIVLMTVGLVDARAMGERAIDFDRAFLNELEQEMLRERRRAPWRVRQPYLMEDEILDSHVFHNVNPRRLHRVKAIEGGFRLQQTIKNVRKSYREDRRKRFGTLRKSVHLQGIKLGYFEPQPERRFEVRESKRIHITQ